MFLSRPPGAGLDRLLLHQAATAAVGSLLTHLTGALDRSYDA